MLTQKQKQIRDFYGIFIKKHGYSPSLEETAKHFRRSKSTIHEIVQRLQEKGYLDKAKNKARSVEIFRNSKGSTKTSLLGIIPAGGPVEAIRNPEPIEVPRSMLSKGANHYALKVSGTSMIEEGISDGDVIIVKEQPTVENGEKAVAYLPAKDAVTLKKIYYDKGRVKLVPANKTMKPFYEKNVEVQGKVVGVLRKEI